LFSRQEAFTILHDLFVTYSHSSFIFNTNDPTERRKKGMKKLLVVALVVLFGALLSTGAFAAWTKGQGPGADSQVDVNAFRNFQKETLPVRDEMAVKRLELRNEFNKEKPDQAKIAALQKEMIDLRTKITDAAKKNGLPDRGFGPGYAGRGGCGGDGPGYGRGYGPGACAGPAAGACAGYGPRCGTGGCTNW
jgi:hypothetical protein